MVLISVSTAPFTLSQTPDSKLSDSLVFGKYGGADHLMIMVRDLKSATEKFRRIGFNVNPWGKFPGGLENAVFYFGNETFLELLGIYDKEQAAGSREAKFLEKHEGATGYAIEVASAVETAAFLKKRGADVTDATPYPSHEDKSNSDNWIWKDVSFRSDELPGNLFFIEYNRPMFERTRKPDVERDRAKVAHNNGAQSLTSVWLAVDDLKAARSSYAAIGLGDGKAVGFNHLKASGYRINAGKCSIWLLESKKKSGPVAEFIRSRGSGVMGVTIRVADLNNFRKHLPSEWSATIAKFKGESLVIPGELTNGLWIEVVE
jgi:catechol 2,3-dioxygenase-like lactoylglutathione lyase family enzyme